jgi:hypothetical protein
MPAYQRFSFVDYRFDAAQQQLELHYGLDGGSAEALHFTETYRFPFKYVDYDPAALEAACFGLFMMAGISYYKTYLPPQIEIRKGQLTAAQAEFFEQVYRQGLGELYAVNQILPPERIGFPVAEGAAAGSPAETPTDGVLLPLGGGKDSLVSVELLRAAKIDFATWTMAHSDLLEPLIQRIAAPHLAAERVLDPQLAQLNRAGAHNGHVPFSAILAFAATISAILAGRRDLVLSNEASAGEANLEYHGLQANHQYSKTLEFERLFQDYLATQITPSVRYFSLLRPVSELRIAELFCNRWLGKYQGVFTSCNRNFKQGNTNPLKWCGECPKCAFVFLIFAPFLPKANLTGLFGGQNLFTKPDLEPTYRELLGIQGHKPFDCVGEIRECREAVVMARATGEYPELDRFEFPAFSYDYKKLGEHAMPQSYNDILLEHLTN